MNYARLIRPSVTSLKPYKPGTTVAQARATYGLTDVIKLSSNENPLGASPLAAAALRDLHDLQIYVDDDHRELRTRLAEPYGLAMENVLVGNGSNEVVRTIFTALLAAGDEIVVADPTFSLFPIDALLFDAIPVKVPLRDGVHDLDAMAAAITPKTKIVVIVDPNNPTGTQVQREDFARFLTRLPDDVVLILDQAYREYAPDGAVEGVDVVKSRPGTIVLRTHSKLYGLASLRFGYALGDPELLGYVQRIRLPFNVSRPAAVAALAALDDTDFVRRSLETNAAGIAQLYPGFARIGLSAYPTAANFVAVTVPGSATEAYEKMLARGVVTRSGDALGMPGRLRITIGTEAMNAAVLDALATLQPAHA